MPKKNIGQEKLIAKGADVNIKASDGKTALEIATDRRHSRLAEMLRNAGARE